MKPGLARVALDQHLLHLLEEVDERGIRLEERRGELHKRVAYARLLFPVGEQLAQFSQHLLVGRVDVGKVAEDDLQLGVVEQRFLWRHLLQVLHERLQHEQ